MSFSGVDYYRPYGDRKQDRNRRHAMTTPVRLKTKPSPQSATINAVRSAGRAVKTGKSSVCKAP